MESLAPSQGPLLVIVPIPKAAPTASIRAMRAWREVRKSREHEKMRIDLAEDIYRKSGDLLSPYM